MKRFNNIFLAFLALVVVACGDPELPFDTFEDLEKGAYARRLSLSGAFTLGQTATSSYTFEVEFYSEDQGRNVASYDWTVEYSGAAGDIAAVSLLSIPASSFTTNADSGLPSTTITFQMADAMAALGLTEAQVAGEDRFRFLGGITLNDGRTFSSANTGTNIISSAAFAGMFRLDASVVCVSDIGGTLNFSNTDMEFGGGSGTSQGACAGTTTGSFDLVDEGDGNYSLPDASFDMFPFCWSDAPANSGDAGMTDVCGNLNGAGSDQYGDAYTYSNLTGAGTNAITFDWINDWGDRGTVTLTRTDGANWASFTKADN